MSKSEERIRAKVMEIAKGEGRLYAIKWVRSDCGLAICEAIDKVDEILGKAAKGEGKPEPDKSP